MSFPRNSNMDSLQVPSNKRYRIQPMDASHFAPHPDRYADDEDDIGLGYQRTLVNISKFDLHFSHLCCAHLSVKTSEFKSYTTMYLNFILLAFTFDQIALTISEKQNAQLTLTKYHKHVRFFYSLFWNLNAYVVRNVIKKDKIKSK